MSIALSMGDVNRMQASSPLRTTSNSLRRVGLLAIEGGEQYDDVQMRTTKYGTTEASISERWARYEPAEHERPRLCDGADG